MMEKRSARQVLFFIFIVTNFLALSIAQPPDFLQKFCSNSGNYTTNSQYQRNLNTTLSSISSNDLVNYGFYNDSSGQEPNRVNAFSLCRGDLSVQACRQCIVDATLKILQDCPNQKEAVSWHTTCMIRYSNRSILGRMETTPGQYFWNPYNVTGNVVEYRSRLRELLGNLGSRAASGDWRRKFATGNTTANSIRIYGLVQCNPDLTKQDCNICLDTAIKEIPLRSDGKNGGRVLYNGAKVLYPSCNVRFENFPFYGPPSVLLSAPPSVSTLPPEGNTRGIPSKFVVLIVLTSIILMSSVIFAFVLLRRKKQKRRMKDHQKIKDLDGIDATELQFEFRTIRDATNNFSVENKLGRGGFGIVYKGMLLDGQQIAVKRLSSNSGQGEQEFKNEVLLVAKLQHKNLARLLGFCLEGSERLLIYEFMPNSSLDTFIFVPVKRSALNWEMRYKIVRGIARGLLYLHEDSRLRIVHRDLKASNILLDANMDAKISDFGMARLFDMDQTQGNTGRIVGTLGYMAPEYLRRGHYSSKSDVFSFGVLILEIVYGQKNSNFRNGEEEADLLTFAWENWREGTSLNLVDPTLTLVGSRSEMMQCMHIGLLCVQERVADRPTMASVVHMLTSVTTSLPMPSKPAFLVASRSDLSTANKQSEHSVNKVSITSLDPR